MKIGYQNKESESETLKSALDTYRQTPHPQTHLPPASVLFRDGMKTSFPRKTISQKEIQNAKINDKKCKLENQQKINSSKYRKQSAVNIGDTVLVRNYRKTIKFEPLFMRQPFKVVNVDRTKNEITVQRGDVSLKRHLDDLKKFESRFDSEEVGIPEPTDEMEFEFFEPDTEGSYTSYFDKNLTNVPEDVPQGDIEVEQNATRRGTRVRNTPSRYEDFELY